MQFTLTDELLENLSADLVRELHQDRRYSTVYAASFFRPYYKPHLFSSLPEMKLEPLVKGCGAASENEALATTNIVSPLSVDACKNLMSEVTSLRESALSELRGENSKASSHMDMDGVFAASAMLGIPHANVAKVMPIDIGKLADFFLTATDKEEPNQNDSEETYPMLARVNLLKSYEGLAFLMDEVTTADGPQTDTKATDKSATPTLTYMDPLGVFTPPLRVLRKMMRELGENAYFVVHTI